jgi:hypothetical protein
MLMRRMQSLAMPALVVGFESRHYSRSLLDMRWLPGGRYKWNHNDNRLGANCSMVQSLGTR